MKNFVLLLLCAVTVKLHAQTDKPFIKLASPTKENNAVYNPRQFISGATCKSCELTVNGNPVKVYPTGGFAYELNMQPGSNTFNLEATAPGKTSAYKKLRYQYSLPVADTVKSLDVASFTIFPEGNLVVSPGDRLQFRVKALPGCSVTVNKKVPLYEMPGRMPGIYQGEYIVQDTDQFASTNLPFSVRNNAGDEFTNKSGTKISMISTLPADIVVTKGRLAHLLFGLGDDRLGGAKMGYIDSLIPLKVTGKVGSLYKIQLSKYRSAYIPDDVVEFLPKGTFTPSSLTGSWRIYGDSVNDYVQIGLSSRLPYQTAQLVDPSRITIDIFGATNNTNWITQLEGTREIRNVYYEQLEDEVLRVTIVLNHQQHWGHQVYYEGNRLTVKVRRQPSNLELRNLRIAIDAGHGGANRGAYGPTGASEKELSLAVALKLRQALRLQGAKTIMTRTTEKFVDNKDRILMYRDSLPDLLVSIHLNSSSDPINVGGTSSFYKHIGFRELSRNIHQRMLQLGLRDVGNNGSFNFMLNSPVEYPNALVEMLFLSNPGEEMLIMDERFQQDIADKILQGIKDFLEACKKDNPGVDTN
jgi:N-acetylmuramoyl-L-alanine amidase